MRKPLVLLFVVLGIVGCTVTSNTVTAPPSAPKACKAGYPCPNDTAPSDLAKCEQDYNDCPSQTDALGDCIKNMNLCNASGADIQSAEDKCRLEFNELLVCHASHSDGGASVDTDAGAIDSGTGTPDSAPAVDSGADARPSTCTADSDCTYLLPCATATPNPLCTDSDAGSPRTCTCSACNHSGCG